MSIKPTIKYVSMIFIFLQLYERSKLFRFHHFINAQSLLYFGWNIVKSMILEIQIWFFTSLIFYSLYLLILLFVILNELQIKTSMYFKQNIDINFKSRLFDIIMIYVWMGRMYYLLLLLFDDSTIDLSFILNQFICSFKIIAISLHDNSAMFLSI